jgi:hypothetical protein
LPTGKKQFSQRWTGFSVLIDRHGIVVWLAERHRTPGFGRLTGAGRFSYSFPYTCREGSMNVAVEIPGGQPSPIRLHYLWYVAAALAVMVAAILIGNTWFLNWVHVMSGVPWTGIDCSWVSSSALFSDPSPARA